MRQNLQRSQTPLPSVPGQERVCESCGNTFKGAHLRCEACQRTERTCESCGKVFKSHKRRCEARCATERTCAECGRVFTGAHLRCAACRATERACAECGRRFTARSSAATRAGGSPYLRKSAKPERVSKTNARRARQLAAEVAGPVPPEVYAAIRRVGAMRLLHGAGDAC